MNVLAHKMLLGAALITATACTPPEGDRFFVRTGGADLYVHVQGDVESDVFLLMLHGGPGGNGAVYNLGLASRTIEEKAAIVYWDQRGQGASRGAYSPSGFDIDTIIDDTVVLVEVLHERYGDDAEVYLFGHSWGGLLGTAALLRTDLQNDIAGWINSDGPHDLPLLNRYLIDMLSEFALEEIAAGRFVDDWADSLKTIHEMDVDNLKLSDISALNQMAYEAELRIADLRYEEEYTLSELSTYLFNPPVAALAQLFTSYWTAILLMDEIESTSLTGLDAIEVPTLLLWGAYDFVVPPQLGYDQLDAIGTDNASLVIFGHAGHSPMINQPTEFAEVILDFVSSP
jgi:pimeloyl-ACP methyl ester carboxylesterase